MNYGEFGCVYVITNSLHNEQKFMDTHASLNIQEILHFMQIKRQGKEISFISIKQCHYVLKNGNASH